MLQLQNLMAAPWPVVTTGCPALNTPQPYRWLHGKQGQDLEQMILNHIADDAILVEVAPTPLSAKVLAEDHLQQV